MLAIGCLYSVEWNGGMEWWNGIVEWWNGGIVERPRPQAMIKLERAIILYIIYNNIIRNPRA